MRNAQPGLSRTDDPRRAGFVAGALAGAYVAVLFIPVSLMVKLVIGACVAACGVGVALRARLPRWKDAPERKRTAMRWMIVESVAICAIATAVRLAVA